MIALLGVGDAQPVQEIGVHDGAVAGVRGLGDVAAGDHLDDVEAESVANS